jgi:spore coat polysaccharide biosynthesis protein SpsF (cytidylyltransferase family)
MVTNNQEGIKGKGMVTIVRVGIIIIIINRRKNLKMIDQTIILARERNKSGR